MSAVATVHRSREQVKVQTPGLLLSAWVEAAGSNGHHHSATDLPILTLVVARFKPFHHNIWLTQCMQKVTGTDQMIKPVAMWHQNTFFPLKCLLNAVAECMCAMCSIWFLWFPLFHCEPKLNQSSVILGANVIVWPPCGSVHRLGHHCDTGPAAALTLGMGSGVQWRGGGGTGHHGLLGAHAGPGGWRRQTEKPPRKASNQSALIHRRQHREPVRTEGGVGAELGTWPEAAVCQLGRVTTSCRDRKMTNYYKF